LNEPRFDWLDDALHVIRKNGTLLLSTPPRKAMIEIDSYKDGKKQRLLRSAELEITKAVPYSLRP
jgi:hypothetical protein